MKKTYINQLPKGMEVKNTSVRVENGKVLVDVEFKAKFEPKDGDFVCYDYKGGFALFICKINESNKEKLGCYASYQKIYEDICWNFNESCYTDKKYCRYATEEEKSQLLERLEKEKNKRWNEEKKCLEDIRWRAKAGEVYYRIGLEYENYIYVFASYESFCPVDNKRHSIGNYYKTKEAAKKIAEEIENIFKNSKAE